ncbi:sulfatase [Haloarcula nitratireducens]|uniref:Sulfatase n=1 Tax=Haloarcula nitratireducens TaxID=2487749 RepID=A0AAW4PHB5_9EURY|nr:sulfatase [Halomicroarcula nitratireducens]MBX0296660.1 sulfatase [Halomicroarcula nitratireducens]
MSEDWENVILLSADALRADHLSCYGYHRETSPVLDELAEESIRFTNAYSASSHTREAVPALLTGKYPDVAIDSKYHLASDTIATTLSEEGFATAGFHSNPFVSRAYGFDQGFDVFDDDLHLGQHKLIALAQRALDKFRNRHYARAEEINERSLKWLDSLDDEEPFFLWNHYMDTHGPYEPPGDYATLYADQGLSGRDAQSLYQRAIDDPESITDDERQLLIDLYDAEIRYNDEYIGELFDELRERDLLERSLLIVTADHGDAFGEHGYYEHPRYLHDEITKVPLFVRPPSGVSRTVNTPASTLDVVSTIKSYIGHDVEFSLLAPSKDNRSVFSQARGEDANSHLRRYALRKRDRVCFCEHDIDTQEIRFTETTKKPLRSELKAHVEQRIGIKNENEPAADSEVDEEIERRLNALGYKD